jgi:hypothetical protein
MVDAAPNAEAQTALALSGYHRFQLGQRRLRAP